MDTQQQPLTYADLVEGDTIVDKSDNKWRVSGIDRTDAETTFWLGDDTNAHAHRLTKPAGDAVTVIRPVSHDEEMDRLLNGEPEEVPEEKMTIEEVAEVLGGTIIAEEKAETTDARNLASLTGEPFPVPLFKDMTMLEQQSHLFLVHGIFAADVKTTKALTTHHDDAHAAHDAGNAPGRHIAHTHTTEA